MTDANVLPPFQVSHSAVQAIQDLGGAVRIDIEDGGCCGTTYVFELVDPQSDAVAQALLGTGSAGLSGWSG